MSEEPTHSAGQDPEAARRLLAAGLRELLVRRSRALGRDLSPQELARALSVSKSSMYDYFGGKRPPPAVLLDRLLTELGATAEARHRLTSLRDSIRVERRLAWPGPLPRQLPPVTTHFAGRADTLRRLDEASTGIVVIDGTAGVGKTTLALHWAHRNKDGFPDGQFHANLRGFDPEGPLDPGTVLSGLLQALDVPGEAIPVDTDGKSALFRSMLDGRRALIVLDNAASAAQVRPLLPGTPACLAIITSRDRLDGLVVRDGAERVSLDLPPEAEALDLLRSRVGAERVAAEEDAASDLVEFCARLPLAIGIAAARAVDRPDRPLRALVERLRASPDRLSALGGAADLDLRAVFRTSYASLPESAARLFRLLGAHTGPDIDVHACAALLDGPPPYAELDVLRNASLLAEDSAGRFASHDLLRVFARDLATGPERRPAIGRLLDYYVHTAVRAGLRIEPCRSAELPDAGPPKPGPKLDDYATAMAWFAAELPVLHASMEQAIAEGYDRHVWRLAGASTVFLRRTGRWAERVAVHRAGLAAAQRLNDRGAAATSMRLLADGLVRADKRTEALGLLRASLAECQELGDTWGTFQAHLSLSRLHDAEGDRTTALARTEQALALVADTGDALALADALTAVAKQRHLAGRSADALPLVSRALVIYQDLGYPEGEAYALRALGWIERRLGRPEQAIAQFERSLELDRRLGDRFWAAHVLYDLAAAHTAAAEPLQARSRRAEALELFATMRHPAATTIRARLMAEG